MVHMDGYWDAWMTSIDPITTSPCCAQKLRYRAAFGFADVAEPPPYEGNVIQITNTGQLPAPPARRLFEYF